MANQLYDFGREGFLGSDIDWDADNIVGVLVDTADYTLQIGTDQHLDDIPAAARVATSAALAGKSITAGVADSDDFTFSGVSGDECELLVLYQDTGAEATSRLIAALDTAINLPVIPDGGDIEVSWDDGSNRIFLL